MLGKYVFQRQFPPRCVCLCTHGPLSLSYPRNLLRNDLMEIFSSSENCEQTRKVKGNDSDRISRIINMLQSLWRETVFVDVAMGY